MEYKNNYQKTAGNVIKAGLVGLALYAINSLPLNVTAQENLDYSKQVDNNKETIQSVLEDNLGFNFSKSDLQYIGAADRYLNIWGDEIKDKNLKERYDAFKNNFNKFKENLHISNEAWIDFYNGEISDLTIYPEQDLVSFKADKSDAYTLNMFKSDIKLDPKFKQYIVGEARFFYEKFFSYSNKNKSDETDINKDKEQDEITLEDVLKDIKLKSKKE